MNARSTLAQCLTLGAFALLASPQETLACDGQVFIRLWQPGGQETWYDAEEEVQIRSGQEGHIYVHVKGRGQQPYSTAARIGYPEEFGYQGDAREVERSVKMEAQTGDDRRYGRIRFRADQQNLVYIGYQITGVASPGSLNSVPNDCRVGYIPIRVTGNQTGGGGRGEGGGRGDGGGRGNGGGRGDGGGRGNGGRGASWEAAENLVGYLYVGILRRDDPGELHQEYIRMTERRGIEGLQEVAAAMFKSQEFRDQALRRLQQEQGRINDRGERINALLWAIYESVYFEGAEPPDRRVDQDYDLLYECLENRDNRACEKMGYSLINNPLYREGNEEDLGALY